MDYFETNNNFYSCCFSTKNLKQLKIIINLFQISRCRLWTEVLFQSSLMQLLVLPKVVQLVWRISGKYPIVLNFCSRYPRVTVIFSCRRNLKVRGYIVERSLTANIRSSWSACRFYQTFRQTQFKALRSFQLIINLLLKEIMDDNTYFATVGTDLGTEAHFLSSSTWRNVSGFHVKHF